MWSGNQRIARYRDDKPDGAHDLTLLHDNVFLGQRLLAWHVPAVGRVPLAYEHPDRVGARLTTFTTTDDHARPFDWETYVLPYGAAAIDDSTAMHDFTTYLRVGNELDYAVNRFYDRGTARFLQPEPLASAAFNLSDPQPSTATPTAATTPSTAPTHLGSSGKTFSSTTVHSRPQTGTQFTTSTTGKRYGSTKAVKAATVCRGVEAESGTKSSESRLWRKK